MGNIKILGVRIHEEAAGLWRNFVYFAESFQNNVNPIQEPINIINKPPLPGDQRRIKVGPREKPYWEENGWWKQDNVYIGRYFTRNGAWTGRIVDRAGMFDIFISKPPMGKLKKHSHGQCFVKAGHGEEYQIHLHQSPADVSSAILHTQQILEESYSL